ncbi:hypothetical protein [Methanosarcina sp.]|jgi:hypothetical protein|uniref:hypothetical protein n=1 Tax=Methanosarcina sp. TaxID=2213 RepID=UPI002CCC63CC|nr:hypothetical protein [Methanosarcina sp.]HOW15231.1 hypothetical protein [Methanosarcina sp.]
MSKFKTVFLSFIASEIFIIIIELTFGIPLNAYYYLDLNLTKPADVTFPLLLSSDEQAGSTEKILFLKSLVGVLLWLLTSPALLIAVVVYILAPDEESSLGVNSYIHTH